MNQYEAKEQMKFSLYRSGFSDGRLDAADGKPLYIHPNATLWYRKGYTAGWEWRNNFKKDTEAKG